MLDRFGCAVNSSNPFVQVFLAVCFTVVGALGCHNAERILMFLDLNRGTSPDICQRDIPQELVLLFILVIAKSIRAKHKVPLLPVLSN